MRKLWSNFDAAIHSQKEVDTLKLVYPLSYLKENALEAVKDYDVTSENYEIMREVLLIEKHGKPSTIIKMLYKEFESIKKRKEMEKMDGNG